MQLKQFRYGDTNLAYLVWSGDTAAAIDGGAADSILRFLEEKNLNLAYVLNTHDHDDHTPGNSSLLKATDAVRLSPGELAEKKHLALGTESLEIFATPGHTADSIIFSHGEWLITGDTLFNGTVGNCYTRDYETYFNSLEKVLSFPPETIIYAGHDLVDYALGVAEKIDPGNSRIADLRSAYDPQSVKTSLEEELTTNPFIRFNDSSLDEFRRTLDMPLTSPYERWRAMMSIH